MNRKKLIEVALPLEAINKASAREKSIRHGHPSTLHLWWARRPLAAARAVIFAQMVDDPSSNPDLFPTEKAQEKERQRLFKIIEDLVQWENTTNEEVLNRARAEIWQSWRRTCADHADHPRAKELFDRNRLPAFHDPFAGGGALPLEAQRLGLESYASDLNPVAVLINKAMIEIPPKFAGRPPVNPDWTSKPDDQKALTIWKGVQGLAEDVRYYGKWMRDEAEKRIGHLYPKIEITAAMAADRPDLTPYIGRKLTVIAWLWARTVKSPNPAFSHVEVPLVTTFVLSKKAGKQSYIELLVDSDSYKFRVRKGTPPPSADSGTKADGRGANFLCALSNTPIGPEYIREQGRSGNIGQRLMAVVTEGPNGRVYLSPTAEQERKALDLNPRWSPELEFAPQALGFRIGNYGFKNWGQMFSRRQLIALGTFCDLTAEARDRCKTAAIQSGVADDCESLESGGRGAAAYADAVALFLAVFVSRMVNLNNAFCQWRNDPAKEHVGHLFSRQAVPMVWDFAEANPLGESGGGFQRTFDFVPKVLAFLPTEFPGSALQADASRQHISEGKLVSTDPPYYDNIGYADLSDFFYVWLRRSLRTMFPALFATVAVPKTEELVATPFRHGGRTEAKQFFLFGMTRTMHNLAEQAHPSLPITIYYAFKQSETRESGETSSTGWETFLEAVLHAGLAITGTWPMRTELGNRIRGAGSNALASSILLVCRPRPADARVATRREFISALTAELPAALAHLQAGNIAPVDLAQAAIGPGMAVFSRHTKVVDGEGNAMTVREALALINQVLDEALAEQEGDFDADSRWALTWFEQQGFAEGDYGMAEQLSKSKNTSVSGLVDAGILVSKAGKVRLLKPSELPIDWDPASDPRLTAWETVHHLVRTLESQGESGSATLVAKLGSRAETARELCYRLYTLCERKKRATEALSYNALVQSWPEITRLAQVVREVQTQTLTEQADLV